MIKLQNSLFTVLNYGFVYGLILIWAIAAGFFYTGVISQNILYGVISVVMLTIFASYFIQDKEFLKKMFPQGVMKNFLIMAVLLITPLVVISMFISNETISKLSLPVFRAPEVTIRILASYFFARSDIPAFVSKMIKTNNFSKHLVCVVLIMVLVPLTLWIAI